MVILGEDAANPFSIDPFFHLGRKINILYQETIFIFERRVWKCSIMRVECSDALCPSFVYTPHLCHKLLWEVSSRTIETDMSAAHWLSDKPLGNPNVEFSIKWETETRLPPLCRRAGECAAGWETRRTATDDKDTVSMQHIVCGAARVCARVRTWACFNGPLEDSRTLTKNGTKRWGNCGLMESSADRNQEKNKLMGSLSVKTYRGWRAEALVGPW